MAGEDRGGEQEKKEKREGGNNEKSGLGWVRLGSLQTS